MPRIGLSDFVEIVGRSGASKVTKVAEIKNRVQYQPALDFYKPLREAIVEGHKNGRSREDLKKFPLSVNDAKKIGNYRAIVAGYTKWWGRKRFEWAGPSSGVFGHGS